jgi:hypothetical protein
MSFKTQAQIFQALLDGKKITTNFGCNYIELVNGQMKDKNGDVMVLGLTPSSWSIYEEPKPKKQVWEWRYRKAGKEWYVDGILCDEIRASVLFDNFEYEKHAGPFEVEDN